ncbi:hypothetical protein EGW08_002818 [Elysia chlorotica]|uniref:Uncharacterized protein n=1 Tax=Elysia chlorotica TaxID=188477 RepID=A0A3S1BR09_ELYCH|nr:hypothetical protein EGW08_002818 [Elysia chlorotica]
MVLSGALCTAYRDNIVLHFSLKRKKRADEDGAMPLTLRPSTNAKVRVYRAVGPLMCTVGSLVMFASCIYFYCYGTGPQGPGGQHHDIEHDGASGSKGSSGRSKSHHSSHHSHHHSQSSHHQSQHHHHHHNGRAVDVASGDGECRLSLRSETAHSTDTSSGPSSHHHHSKNSRRSTGMAAAAEEEVPLAQMEDSFDLNVKGQ